MWGTQNPPEPLTENLLAGCGARTPATGHQRKGCDGKLDVTLSTSSMSLQEGNHFQIRLETMRTGRDTQEKTINYGPTWSHNWPLLANRKKTFATFPRILYSKSFSRWTSSFF